MGWAVGNNGHRDIGYGVPAYCDFPGCNEKIDRGLGYLCGDFFSDVGCGLYFCGDHMSYGLFDSEGNKIDEDDEEEKADEAGVEVDDSDWVSTEVCFQCRDGLPSFPEKEDHPDWIWWKLNAPSWARWRSEEPEVRLLLMAARLVELEYVPSEDMLEELADDE